MTLSHITPTQLKARVRAMAEAVARGEQIEHEPFMQILLDICDELDALWLAVENPLVHVEPSTGGAGRP